MLIVIDTTETFQEPLLSGPDWTFVDIFLRREITKLVVPEIVIDETLNHFKIKTVEAVRACNKALGMLNKLAPGSNISAVDNIDINNLFQQYSENLSKRLSALSAIRIPYEQVELKNLVIKSLGHKKPFDGKGQKGFRDAVIWASIIQFLKTTDDRAVLVTCNTNDFGTHGHLADDLLEDLSLNGLDRDRIFVCDGLRKFVNEYVKPKLNKLDEITSQINDNVFPGFNIDEYFDESYDSFRTIIEEKVRDWTFHEVDYMAARQFNKPRLSHLHTYPTDIFIDDVYRVDHNTIAFGIHYNIDGLVEYQVDFVHDPYDEPGYIEYESTVSFVVCMTIVMNLDNGEVTDSSIDEVVFEPGSDWPHP